VLDGRRNNGYPTPMRAWVSGTLDLDLSTVPAATVEALKQRLTLTQTGYNQSTQVPFFVESPGWLHLPRGFWFCDSEGLLRDVEVLDNRSDGHPLPTNARARVEFGAPPFPPGQPQFIATAHAAALSSGHGGMLEAPTRSGKTLCAAEIACRLGGSTLILGDNVELLGQWQDEIQEHIGLPCGIIREDRFDYGPQWPFVVATVQTLARRALPEEVRRSWRTLIIDECNSAPCATIWGAVQRIYARYVFGLTATPDRSDGLGEAISWVVGPTIAKLARTMTADAQFLHIPWRACKIPREGRDGKMRNYKPVLRRNGVTSWVAAEQSIMQDEQRLTLLADEVLKGLRGGRKPLVMVGIVEHGERWAEALRARGMDVGCLMGKAKRSEGAKEAVVATYRKAGRAMTIMPPATLFVPAGPVRDIRQAVGRSLQPQATHRTLILDPVDLEPSLVKWARCREQFYAGRGFTLRNRVRAA